MANNLNPPAAELPTVEALAETTNTPAWALAGLRVREGWPIGFKVSEAEYLSALERFLTGPTNGPSEDKAKKAKKRDVNNG